MLVETGLVGKCLTALITHVSLLGVYYKSFVIGKSFVFAVYRNDSSCLLLVVVVGGFLVLLILLESPAGRV